MTYEDVAQEAKLNPGVARRYVEYMRLRWADSEAEKCTVGYAQEWANHFKNGWEWLQSDLDGQRVIRDMEAQERGG